jgi:hypothetical protein
MIGLGFCDTLEEVRQMLAVVDKGGEDSNG